MNPSELQASQSAGSKPSDENVAVVRSSVVRMPDGATLEEVEAVEVEGSGEWRPASTPEPDATDPDSESDMWQ